MKLVKQFFFLLFLCNPAIAQDIDYARKVIEDLCAPELYGRGYVNGGDEAAAHYLRSQLEKMGVTAFDFNYYQDFKMSVNTFPEAMEAEVDGKQLQPGIDFLVSPDAPSLKGEYDIIYLDKSVISNPNKMDEFEKSDKKDKAVLLDSTGFNKVQKEYFLNAEKNPFEAAVIIKLLPEKLTWGVSQNVSPFTTIEILKDIFPVNAKKIKLNISNKFLPKYGSQNILGFIEGKTKPDSSIVFSAHYDHLGMMGSETIFPGANDNASGTSMLLNLAQYYSKPENKPDYTMVFIFFGAEEAGLVGSKFYTENPVFPLEEIKFLINIDLAGTGEEGITVVNGSVFEKEFNKLVELNDAKKYLAKVKVRGKAANSDHYYFSENGVPAFFIYTMGGIKAYHDVYDKPETLPLTEFQRSE
ncbi:MAG: M28 family metallopeptidase, partial [Bacteroidia bacterium]